MLSGQSNDDGLRIFPSPTVRHLDFVGSYHRRLLLQLRSKSYMADVSKVGLSALNPNG